PGPLRPKVGRQQAEVRARGSGSHSGTTLRPEGRDHLRISPPTDRPPGRNRARSAPESVHNGLEFTAWGEPEPEVRRKACTTGSSSLRAAPENGGYGLTRGKIGSAFSTGRPPGYWPQAVSTGTR